MMVENVADYGVEPKPSIIEASGAVKPIVIVKLKVKITFQAHIEEKPKLVPTGFAKLCGYEVDTTSFFLTKERWRERNDFLGWVLRQPTRAGFTISIDKSSLKRPTLTMQCERSGEYKPSKTRKKLNLDGTGSRKCEFLFRLCGLFDMDTNDWWLAILSGSKP